MKSAIAENSESCKKTTVEPGFLTRQDINADGRPDYILDYSFVRCDGRERGLCGSLGCTVEVFASLPEWHVRESRRQDRSRRDKLSSGQRTTRRRP